MLFRETNLKNLVVGNSIMFQKIVSVFHRYRAKIPRFPTHGNIRCGRHHCDKSARQLARFLAVSFDLLLVAGLQKEPRIHCRFEKCLTSLINIHCTAACFIFKNNSVGYFELPGVVAAVAVSGWMNDKQVLISRYYKLLLYAQGIFC